MRSLSDWFKQKINHNKMKKIIFIMIFILIQNTYSQFKYDGNWVIKSIKTNHVLKGPIEEFELPTKIIGKIIFIHEKRIDIRTLMEDIDDLSLYENHSPFFYVQEKHLLEIIKDNSHNQFPGDELGEIFEDKNKVKSKIGTSFTNLLKINPKLKELLTFKIYGKNNYNPNCLLITTDNPNELILFIYNDELLFFLKKK